jgi:hypothetical protein
VHALITEIQDKGFISPSDLYQRKFSRFGVLEDLAEKQLDEIFAALEEFAPGRDVPR